MRDATAPFRVLIIDDDELIRGGIALSLGFAGYSVETASSGPKGLHLLRQKRFDIVLMDVEMPGMSGIEAVAHIRAEEGQGPVRVPVVALSAADPTGYGLVYGEGGFVPGPAGPDDAPVLHLQSAEFTLNVACW